ncbi:TetR/AcrR family transcriptional regulator C-terminal domain-containing protein [Pseudarthrobacter sp. S9]|uniref:TetR/AcrR family transcriptional regulator C-terminal domain-containing protein n=1 Tax=Pseudarthrobacter sp. S9 TaxID=3418421 RepID=UPI003CFBEA85
MSNASNALHRRVGRPNKSVLSRELILVTALRVLKRTGPDDFTMAALAADLGVKSPALYHHVGGKRDILAGIREYISDRIDTSAFGVRPWPEAVTVWARSYRAAFAAHPHAIALLATLPIAGAHRTLAMYEVVARGFVDSGWPEELVINNVVALENFILGSALDAVAPADMLEPGDFADEVPVFATALQARDRTDSAASPADQAFELGLAAIVTGLEASRAVLTQGGRER